MELALRDHALQAAVCHATSISLVFSLRGYLVPGSLLPGPKDLTRAYPRMWPDTGQHFVLKLPFLHLFPLPDLLKLSYALVTQPVLLSASTSGFLHKR